MSARRPLHFLDILQKHVAQFWKGFEAEPTRVNLKYKKQFFRCSHLVIGSFSEVKNWRLATYQFTGEPYLNTYSSFSVPQTIISKVRFACSPTWVLNHISKHSYHSSIFRTTISWRINERIWYEFFPFSFSEHHHMNRMRKLLYFFNPVTILTKLSLWNFNMEFCRLFFLKEEISLFWFLKLRVKFTKYF